MYEFETPTPITLAVRIRSGDATLIAEERDTAVVEVTPADGSDAARDAAAQTRVQMSGTTLSIEAPEFGGGWLWRRGGGVRVLARVPRDSTLSAQAASAPVTAHGRWADGSLHSASGDVTVDAFAGDVHASTASGDLRVGSVGGNVRANSASGNLLIGAVGRDAALHSASGNLRIDDAAASVTARTASGDVQVHQARRGEVRVHTASGDVVVSVLPGTGVYLDVNTAAGRTRSDLDIRDAPVTGTTADLRIRARTASGDVSVLRAHPKESETPTPAGAAPPAGASA